LNRLFKRHSILLAFLAACAFSLVFLVWLSTTPAGARWTFSAISRLTGLHLEARQIEGRMAGDLRLGNLKITWSNGSAAIDSLDLQWHPLQLLEGRLAVEKLAARGMTLEEQVEEKKPSDSSNKLSWPVLSGPATWFEGTLESLRVENLRVFYGSEEPLLVDRLSGKVFWQHGLLSVRELDVATPDLDLRGETSAGFVEPSLAADLNLEFHPSGEEARHIALSLDLSHSPSPGRLFAGPFAATLGPVSPQIPHLKFDAKIEVGETGILIHTFELTVPGRQGTIDGKGELSLAGEEPSLKLQARIDSLDLEPEAGIATALSGTLEFSGDRNRYQGSFALTNRGEGWKELKISSPFSGDFEAISLPALEGEWLGGGIRGTLDFSWQGETSLKAALQGRNLEPEKIRSDWPGVVNFNIKGTYRQKEGQSPMGTIEAKLLDSTLRGRVLRGDIQAKFAEGDVRIAQAALHGDGFDADAHGSLTEKLAFQVEIRKLSGLVPGVEGQVNGSGWVRRNHGLLGGSIRARGRGLAYAGIGAKELHVAGAVSDSGKSFSLEANGRGLKKDDITLDSASLQVKGTREKHQVHFALHWPKGKLEGAAAGGFSAETWKGRLVSLRGWGEGTGTWHLEEPVSLAVGAEKAAVMPAAFASESGERLHLAADLSWHPLLGSVDAKWEKFDLAHANIWLKGMALSGRSDGNADIRWLEGDRLELEGKVALSGKMAFQGKTLTIDRASAQVRWDEKGLQSSWNVDLGQKAFLRGDISSPLPARPQLPLEGSASLNWKDVDLSLLGPWVPETEIAGESSGDCRVHWGPGENLEMKAEARLSGKLDRQGLELDIRQASATVDGNEKGVSASLEVVLAPGGKLKGEFSSSEPLKPELPGHGKVVMDWQDLEMARFKSFLPRAVQVDGRFSGQIHGRLLPDRRLDFETKASLDGGMFEWSSENGKISAVVKTAELTLAWQEKTLSGELNLALADYGRIHGDFLLPLPARLPTALEETGPVRGRLAGEMKEKGLLSALFPGLVRESRGRVNVDLAVGGTWAHPDYSGTLEIADGAAFLLTAGIQLEKIQARGHFVGERIEIEYFQAVSGPGRLQGSAIVRLKDWNLESYQATVKGERFEAIHLPELQMEVSPDLTLGGAPGRIKVRGKVLIPHLLATRFSSREPVQPSPDVVIVGISEAEKKTLPIAIDIEVRVVLGDRVLVKGMGLDARLVGDVTIRATSLDNITGEGEIKVAQGSYSAYGVGLKITRGTVLFSGGSVTRPTLDVEASRKVQDVTAGVKVTGTPQNPKVALYSDPTMSDTDILAYIVLGHPMGADRSQASLLMVAAGGLLSQGESSVVQDKIKNQLGLSELSVESGGENLEQSMVTVGKYLNPDLYIGLGQSLFTNSQEVRMRYNLSKRWEVESRMGAQSGVDLYYKIEFE
jgi:translocation and assembly module TamB